MCTITIMAAYGISRQASMTSMCSRLDWTATFSCFASWMRQWKDSRFRTRSLYHQQRWDELSRGWIFSHLSLLRLIDNPGLVYSTPGKCEHTSLFLRLGILFTLIRVDGASDKEISKMVLEKLCWHFSLRNWHCLTKIKMSSLFETSWFSLKHLYFVLIIFRNWSARREKRS